MTAKVGLRRLLIALSSLYWFLAAIAAWAAGSVAERLCITRVIGASWSLDQTALDQCPAAFAHSAAITLAGATGAFGLAAVGYVTVRWVVRGFRA